MFDVGRSFFNPVLVIEYWSLIFICILVLEICIFRNKTPRQSHLALTWPRRPGFQWKNKN